jgi:hypothetical protein
LANNTLLASDDFSSGSLSALKWTATPTQVKSQVAGSPFVAEAPAIGTPGRQYYSGVSWPNDQISEFTLNHAITGGQIELWVRVQSSTQSGYVLIFLNGGTATLYRGDSGVFTQIGSGLVTTPAAGDVFTLQVAGSVLTGYQNNNVIFHAADTTYATGSAGFGQTATSAVTNTQIASWRGYNTVQQDGIWQKQNCILAPLSGDFSGSPLAGGVANATMLYEGNAQLLSGTVFKMWFSAGGPTAETNTYYAESTDGLTWTRRGTAVITGQGSPFVFKNGATYYLYTQPSGSAGGGNWSVYTSSDGITWASQATNILPLGGVGTWDHLIGWYFQPVDIINGTWWAVYSGGNDTTGYQLSLGLASSPDGIVWTKYVSNPVLAGPGNGSVVNACFSKVGSTYYAWFYGNQPGGGGQSGSVPNLDPGEGVRYKSTDLKTWTFDCHSVHRSQMYEGYNYHGGQCFPNAILDYNGKAYMFIQSASSDNGAPLLYQLSVAIGPTTISSLVTKPEDAASQQATDGFTSGAGSLSANWTTQSGLSALQIVSGPVVEAGSTSTNCGARYTGASFTDSQYSEITLAALTATTAFVYPTVRVQANGSCYAFKVVGAIATATTCAIYKVVGGVFTQIGPSGTITPAVGDVFRLQVINGPAGYPVLSAYQNGFQLLVVEDFASTLTSGGVPGMIVNAATLTNAQISSWAGGNSNVIPSYITVGNFITKPVPVTVTNANGFAIAITTPTTDLLQGAPTAVCFTDTNGNELTVTGGTTGSEIAAPVPVVLCDPNGLPLTYPKTITSNTHSIVVTSTLTGKKLGQPRPVVLTDENGFGFTVTGSGTFVCNPTPIALCDLTGKAITMTLS